MDYLISAILIACSALFSGLTLGFFSLDTYTLKRQANLGNTAAAAIFPLRKQGNLLLTTLLLGNVAVNTALSIYLGSIASGIVAGAVATTLIFLFGEILPQAVMSRHALYYGSLLAPVVKLVMWILLPLTYPIAKILDWFLGEELPTLHSKHELMHIVSEHQQSTESPIDADEERIVHGALQFSHRQVYQVMTPLDQVQMFDARQRLTDAFYEQITEDGYSRYPVYNGARENVIGILFVKDLLVEDENISLHDTTEALDQQFLRVTSDEFLDTLLAKMLKQRRHMAIVYNQDQRVIGIITLEDIIEEIIQFEIEDEDD